MKKLFIIKILAIFFVVSVTSNTCKNNYFLNYGTKAFCEHQNGLIVDCRGSLYNVKKAYVKCNDGYYNEKNLSMQELNCMENGEWSDKKIECIPECIEFSNIFNLTLIEDNCTTIPNWYVEIIRKEPKEGQINKIPGVILSERLILVSLEFSKTFFINFGVSFIRVYNSKRKFKDYSIALIKEQEKFNLLYLKCDEYIEFNNDVKPICLKNPTLGLNSLFQNYDVSGVFAPFCQKCVADYYNEEFTLSCFDMIYRDGDQFLSLKPIECRKKSDYIMSQCYLGYTQTNDVDNFSFCHSGNWHHNDIKCELICGQIDDDYYESKHQMIYKGNNKTDISEFPWHVAIFVNQSNTSQFFKNICGGTIVHWNIVISAAHCFYNYAIAKINNASKYQIGAGKNYRNYEAIEKYGYITGIKEIHVAHNYHPTETLNDIAVLILKENLKYSSHIRPACLNFIRYSKYNTQNAIEGYVAGWGAVNNYGTDSNELLKTKLKILSNDQCKNLVNVNLKSEVVGDKFCAIGENNSTVCPGDSGGGFLTEEDFGFGKRYYLTGIVSTSIDSYARRRIEGCTDGFIPQFTNVQFYQNFINDIIAENRLLNSLPTDIVNLD